ncbi:hypothetical protein CLW00_10550 [Mongoliibacter ruber]|uniref:Uncharacterized protein n=1 Tax=Mongoliibacter ruber TaxID=1750599 RepID=A0A2T0WMJ8_9BACT|nr:hypothetical protein CLW00_10550 [Mongoliibacter ruber]
MKKSILLCFALVATISFTSRFSEAQNIASGYYEKHESCNSPEGVTVMKCRPAVDAQCNVSGQVPCSAWEEMLS